MSSLEEFRKQQKSNSSGKSRYDEYRETKRSELKTKVEPVKSSTSSVFEANKSFTNSIKPKNTVTTNSSASKTSSNSNVSTKLANSVAKTTKDSVKSNERKDWVNEKVKASSTGNKIVDSVLDPISNVIYSGASFAAPWVESAGQNMGTKTDVAPYDKTSPVNKTLGVVGGIVGASTNPSNLGQGLLGTSMRVGNQVANKISTIAPKLSNNILNKGIEGAVAGGIQGGVNAGVTGQTDLKGLATNVGLGVAFGGAGDAALSGIGSGVRALRNTAKNAAEGVTQSNIGTINALENANAFNGRNRVVNGSENIMRRTEIPTLETNASTIEPTVSSNRVRNGNERGFLTTLQNSGKLTEDTSNALSRSKDRTYEAITNQGTLDNVNAKIMTKGVDKVEAELLNTKKFKADDVATGMRLIQDLQTSGNVDRAVTIAERLAKELTEAGQTVQAASIWNRLSPEGALLAAQRKVNNINDNLLRGQKEVKITPQTANNIMEAAQTTQAAGISQERSGNVMTLLDRIKKGEQITDIEKQEIADFVADAKRFVGDTKEPKIKTPKVAKTPKEMTDVRVKDRVVSFLEEQEQAAKERLRAKGVQISSNPIDIWADYAYIGALKLAKSTVNFADWSAEMIKDFGDSIKPHLSNIYEKSKETLNATSKKINDQVISQAEKVTDNYIKNHKNLDETDIKMLKGIAQKVSSLSGQEKRLASQDLQEILNGFEKVGVGRKLSAAQYVSMLLNPLTQMRNIVGNELLYRTERLSKLISTPIDMATSKLTGKDRTITFKSGKNVWDDFFKTTSDYWGSLGEGAKSGWRGISPEGLTTQYDIQGNAFTSKYNPLRYMEKALGAVLQGFDYAAYTRATNQVMREMAYLDALNKGMKSSDEIRSYTQTYMANIDDTVHEIASDYGKFVTLQNDTLLSDKISGFKRGMNQVSTFGLTKDYGAGSIFIPFAKTPANLLLRGMDYSPIGILKSLKETVEILMKPNTDLTRADVIGSVSRSLVGTGFGATAYWLADKGVLFGKSDEDNEVRKLMQASGVKDFQINGSALKRMVQASFKQEDIDEAAKMQPGDTLWAYEWAQPVSMPFAVGANLNKSIEADKGVLSTAGGAALDGVNTLLDSSVLSSLAEIFKVDLTEDNAFKTIAMNMVKQVPSQFVPSMVRQLNTVYDNTTKETYAMKGDIAGSILNSSKANIPGLSQQMPQRVSTLGEPQTKLNSVLDVFISPASRSKYEPTPEAQLVIELMQETGDKTLAPRAVAKFIKGKDKTTKESKRVDLTPEQYVKYQRIVGEATSEGLKKINGNLSTEKKVEKVLDVLDKAGKEGKKEMMKELNLK